MSTETAADLPSVEELAVQLYQLTSATAASLAFVRLPEDAKAGYRRFVREAQAVELRRMAVSLAASADQPASGTNRMGFRVAAGRLSVRADELVMIGGAQ